MVDKSAQKLQPVVGERMPSNFGRIQNRFLWKLNVKSATLKQIALV